MRKAIDSECPGMELAKVLSQELLKRRERSGQRGFVDVEVEGRPEVEPPKNTRPDIRDVMGTPSAPSMASGSGGAGRMPTISEDQPNIPAPPPTTTRSETESVMGTQPEVEP